ncbi:MULTISPECIES: hypothetical protein [unclassified Sphingomonas]|uniref:hypothetical protein n=1 Tax=unclassified Sphingomonas TaxID=196159 RepID=UPI00138EF639|nr:MULTISPECIES: hypothetical protein [unclassified Sphingomonas]
MSAARGDAGNGLAARDILRTIIGAETKEQRFVARKLARGTAFRQQCLDRMAQFCTQWSDQRRLEECKMDRKSDIATHDASGSRKTWETPDFERYDARRETQSKYATVTEFSSTTGPTS